MSDAPRLIQERHGEVLKLAIANPAARNQRGADCEEGIKAFFEKRRPLFNRA